MPLDPVTLKALAIELAASLPPPPPTDVQFRPVDTSPRAMKMRRVIRIADSYGWHSAITHFLGMKGVSYLSDLTPPQLDDLLERMEGYLDAAETGASLADCLPAS